jgi:hypothetical protein
VRAAWRRDHGNARIGPANEVAVQPGEVEDGQVECRSIQRPSTKFMIAEMDAISL